MPGINERNQLQRLFAEAGLICLSAGLLLNSGCAGTSREGHATTAAANPKAQSRQVAATGRPGRTTLSDQRPSSQQIAAHRKAAATPGVPPRPHTYRPTETAVAQRPAAPRPRVSQAAAVAAQRPAPAARNVASTASKSGNRGSVRGGASNSRPIITPAGVASNSANRTVAQVSAKSTRKSGEVARAKKPIITPAGSVSTVSREVPQGEFERQRADKLMSRAQRMLQNGFRDEAMRLASVAEQLEKTRQATYQPGEMRPSDFIRQLRTAEQREAAETRAAEARAAEEQSIVTADASEVVESSPAPVERRKTYRNRSKPAVPITVDRSGRRIELTEIIAGWQSASETEIAAVTSPAMRRSSGAVPRFESDERSTSTATIVANEGHKDIVQPELQAPVHTDGEVVSADARGPLFAPSDGGSDQGPMLAAAESHEIPELAPPRESGYDEHAIAMEDAELPATPAEHDDPAVASTGTTKSRLNLVSLAGLITGLAGLIGLAWWRRRHQ
jgi:hypothetical protein